MRRMASHATFDRDRIGALIARDHRIAAAWVFGSVARGDATRASDLDVAVLLRESPPRADDASLRALSLDLEAFSPSGRVDMVLLGAQGPVFRHRVLREGVLVVDADPARRQDFEGRTIAEYLDWKPTHEIAMASSLQGLRRRFARKAS